MKATEGPLAGKTALVTGAASGMGLAHARLLHARGASVTITDLDDDRLAQAKAGFASDGDRVLAVRADNAEVADIQAAVTAARAAFGPVDILVNNAGVSGKAKPIEAIDEADFDLMMAAHVKGAFFFAQAVVGEMKQRGQGGRIINITSHFTMIGSPSAAHYTLAKTALNGMTRALAIELAPWRITVNSVAPALVSTPMTQDSVGFDELARRAQAYPLGRLAEPDDIAYAVAWLASAEADMVTGQLISPNGGIAIVGM
jgi:3-oxoacyl-[acyl-carrier protein] reductase